ncbi:MAG: sigma factor-like helix-turn-helix DNA-binding protein [Planctomycetaceae bacterium]|nr:sigma factor-like helix-turn-helix DNA-binding protein [Planctomycetaceae bacterium]
MDQSQPSRADREALFDAIIKALWHPLQAAVAARCRGTKLSSEVDDITGEAFLKLWNQITAGNYDEMNSDNWEDDAHLTLIRRKLFLEARSARIRQFHRTKRMVTNIEKLELTPCRPTSESELLSEVEVLLKPFSPQHREAFLLRLEGCSFAKIAEIQGVAEATARVRYHRVCLVLREKLVTLASPRKSKRRPSPANR